MINIRALILCAVAAGLLFPAGAMARPMAGQDSLTPGRSAARLRPARKKPSVRRWAVKKSLQVRRKLRLGKRIKGARTRFMATRAGKHVRRLTKKTRRLGRATRGLLTATADTLERRLPPGSRRVRLLRRARAYSPLSMAPYSLHKFKKDPVFLGAYKGFSWTFGKVAPPVLFKLGAGVSASLIVPGVVGGALDIGFIFGREHQLKKRQNPDQTVRQTARELGGEYRGFVDKRRQQNRRYFKVYTSRIFGKK